MHKILVTISVFLLLAVNVKICWAQLPLAGKYLVLMNDADGENTDKKTPVEINKDGILLILLANGDTMPLAKMTDKKTHIKIDFMFLFEETSGDFNLKYLPQGHFQLKNEQAELLFFPFIKEEVTVNNKAMGIAGQWTMKNKEETLILEFKLPYTLHIEHTKDYTKSIGDVFWVSQINGEDVTVTNTLFFDKMSGILQQTEIVDDKLHFTYKGKEYEMQKINETE